MNKYPPSVQNLIQIFSHFPGLGPKAAERVVFYLLKQDSRTLDNLMAKIDALKNNTQLCSRCYNIAAEKICNICSDKKRDTSFLCVVAEPQDIQVIENSGEYTGLYHVLGGVLNPVENITPDKLKIAELLSRAKQNSTLKEIIIATNPDLEGESMAMYLARQLKPSNLKITRLAKGLPIGSTIEYADGITISNALQGRREM